MNSNKILFITSEFPPQPGGIGNHAFNLASSLQKEGQDITVLTDVRSTNGKNEQDFDQQLYFEVKRVKRRKIIVISYLDRFFKAMSLISKTDIVFASGKFSLWLVFFLRLFYNKKYIAIIHGSELLLPNKFLRKFTYRSLKKFDEIVAVSNYTKNVIRGLNLKNISVIPNGFSVSEIHQSQLPLKKPEALHLITVGNVTQRKGQHNVIKVIPELLKTFPKLTYHIVGIPTEKEKLEALANNLKVEGHIKFHGKVSEEKKHELLASSSIFMMLSEETKQGAIEGFGIAILEANALGIPAIGSKDCGIEDAISHKKSGCLVQPKEIKTIVDAVIEINTSFESYSKKAKDWSKQFTWDKIVKQYMKIVNK